MGTRSLSNMGTFLTIVLSEFAYKGFHELSLRTRTLYFYFPPE